MGQGEPGSKEMPCPTCGGKGVINQGQGGFSFSRHLCNLYWAEQNIQRRHVKKCYGTGTENETKTLAIDIPAGIENEGKIRLRAQGEPSLTGGAHGDLIITVMVEKDSFFSRDKNDIHATIPITLRQAIKGAKVKITTVSDEKIMLTIKAGTQPGSKLRIPGRGIAKSYKPGDRLLQ
jgi:molecular chaperone DnaJ